MPITDDTTVIPHSCGTRTFVCPHCHALKWEAEKTLHKLCCNSGKTCNVGLLFPEPFPQPLRDLLRYDVSDHQNPPFPIPVIKKFRASLRHYNCALQMASSFANVQRRLPGAQSLMIIHGSVHHCIGSLMPRDGERPRFMQMFFIDDINEQVNCRMLQLGGEEGGLNRELLLELQTMLHNNNRFVHQFKQLLEEVAEGEVADYTIHINHGGQMDRRYDEPTGQGKREVATVIPGNARNTDVSEGRSIQLRVRGGGLHYISDCHPWFDGLHFVLFHPQGQDGWSPKSIRLILPEPSVQQDSVEDSAQQSGVHLAEEPNAGNDFGPDFDDDEEDTHIEHTNERRHRNRTRKRKREFVSLQEYTCYNMHDRDPEGNASFHFGKRLYQEYICDKAGTIEGQKLAFNEHHQQDILRTDEYQGLTDAFHAGEMDSSNLGRRVILPSSFTGGPRYMSQLYQDAMAIVRSKGTPNLWMTITCDSNCPEIKRELKAGELPEDRPDLIARVFSMKVKAIMNCIIDSQRFSHNHLPPAISHQPPVKSHLPPTTSY